jgi:hypothetical protein
MFRGTSFSPAVCQIERTCWGSNDHSRTASRRFELPGCSPVAPMRGESTPGMQEVRAAASRPPIRAGWSGLIPSFSRPAPGRSLTGRTGVSHGWTNCGYGEQPIAGAAKRT